MARKEVHPNMIIRRILLDGIKIMEPYRKLLVKENVTTPSVPCANEVALLNLWMDMARTLALKLKRHAEGKEEKA